MTTDLQLLSAYRAGEVSAFEALYDKYAPSLLTFILGMVGNRDEAEEILQGVFAKLADQATDAEIYSNLRAYLYASARNGFKNKLRSRSRQSGLKEKYEVLVRQRSSEFQEPQEPIPEHVRLQLNKCLGHLSEPEREVVLLKTREEVTFEEVASVLNLPMGTGATRYRTALQKLRRCMGDE